MDLKEEHSWKHTDQVIQGFRQFASTHYQAACASYRRKVSEYIAHHPHQVTSAGFHPHLQATQEQSMPNHLHHTPTMIIIIIMSLPSNRMATQVKIEKS